MRTVQEVRRITLSFEYRNFPNMLTVAADIVDRELATVRLTAEALGFSTSSIMRAITAIRQGRPCGVNGHPTWLTPDQQEQLAERLRGMSAEKLKVTTSVISEEARGFSLVLLVFQEYIFCFLSVSDSFTC